MDATPPLPAQDMMMKPMEEIITNITSTNTCSSTSLDGRKVINPRKDSAALNCPRCNSSNTKFCYYNNYSLAQPRYFCRTCRRYWTQGGSLRDIPIGGKTRKNKRKYSSTPSPTPNINLPQDLVVNQPSSLNPNPKLISPHAQDFSSSYLPSMEVFKRNNDASSMGLVISPYMPMPFSDQNPNPVYTFGLPFQGDFRASLGLSLDAIGSVDDHQQGDSTGYWNGNILGGDGSW